MDLSGVGVSKRKALGLTRLINMCILWNFDISIDMLKSMIIIFMFRFGKRSEGILKKVDFSDEQQEASSIWSQELY